MDVSFVAATENLTPAELKKMKRKQRKAQKKAEMEQQKQKAEMERREQNKNKANDGEMDGPKEEELVPDKLARVRQTLWYLLETGREDGAAACFICRHQFSVSRRNLLIEEWQRSFLRGENCTKHFENFQRCFCVCFKQIC